MHVLDISKFNPVNNLHGDLGDAGESLVAVGGGIHDLSNLVMKARPHRRDYADSDSYNTAKAEWTRLEESLNENYSAIQNLILNRYKRD